MLVLAAFFGKLFQFLCRFTTLTIFHVITALPYFYIARNAGVKRPWLVFIPFGKEYIAFTIPACQYNLGFIKTNKRSLMFWIYLIPEIIFLFLNNLMWSRGFMILSSTIDFSNLDDLVYLPEYIGELLFGEPIFLVILLVFLAVLFIFWLLRSVLGWRKNYDLLKSYPDVEKHALWVSIANIFCPLLMFIFSFILMNKIPYNNGFERL